tara:strand:- start:2299 stop:3264 length:966 start_codon:yes stop_codon:yes gene_type:complete
MYIVTGAVGFIGTCLVRELNNRGIENVLVVDRLDKSSKWKNFQEMRFFDYVDADSFLEMLYDFPDELADKIQGVFHLGACSSTTEMDMNFLMENNVNYSKAVFEFCSAHQVPLLYASSAATYGDGENGYDDESDISTLKPLNPYGQSKQLFDQWALKQTLTPPKWFGVKFFNVFGPFEYHKKEMRSVVHKSFEQINEVGRVRLFKSHKGGVADGEQLRDFVYGVDVARACVEMLGSGEGGLSGIYNMGTGEARSFKDLVTATFKAMNKPTNIEYFDMPENLRDQYQYFTEAKMNKFKTLLPEFTFLSLEDAVEDYVKNYLL